MARETQMYPKLGLVKEVTACDAVAVLMFEAEKTMPEGLPEAVREGLLCLFALGDFKAKTGKTHTIPLPGPIQRLLLAGLGKREAFDLDNVRWAAAAIARAARGMKLADVVIVPGLETQNAKRETRNADMGQAIAEGLVLGGFLYDEFKKPADGEKMVRTRFQILARENKNDWETGIRVGVAVAEGANFAREIASKPGNVINPKTLTGVARELARRAGLKITVIHFERATALGMGGLAAVGQGSVEKPALILLEYKGRQAKGKLVVPVAIVGKAVTFDTGGISIKPAADMDAMKYDKCGGMAVLGVMQAVAELNLPVHLIGVIPTAENSVSSAAFRPGDILTLYNGKTVEVTNTDAEGRLILGDALAYAGEKYAPEVMIDMATLTGGVVVALGTVYAGLFANDDPLAAALEAAGTASGELLWRLPLHERYKPLMDGMHADLQNAGGREAHPVQGAIFLQHFVPQGIKWAHLDIAGVAHPKKDDRYITKGASGFGVRLLVEWLRKRSTS